MLWAAARLLELLLSEKKTNSQGGMDSKEEKAGFSRTADKPILNRILVANHFVDTNRNGQHFQAFSRRLKCFHLFPPSIHTHGVDILVNLFLNCSFSSKTCDMGRVRNNRARTSKKKEYKKGHDVKRRRRDVDQIQDDLALEVETGTKFTVEIDDDLPGRGQFYCTFCARHFADQATLTTHEASKDHKRRLKDVKQVKYTQEEADRGAGKSIEVLPKVNAGRTRQATAMQIGTT